MTVQSLASACSSTDRRRVKWDLVRNKANHMYVVLKLRFFRVISEKNRKCNYLFLDDIPWLRFGVSRDSVYCCYCKLFSNDLTLKMRTSDWSNVAKVMSGHHSETNKSHHACVVRGEGFK